MIDGKKSLAERILHQALARERPSAHRPGIDILEQALRNATPSSRSSLAASVAPRTKCPLRSAAIAA